MISKILSVMLSPPLFPAPLVRKVISASPGLEDVSVTLSAADEARLTAAYGETVPEERDVRALFEAVGGLRFESPQQWARLVEPHIIVGKELTLDEWRRIFARVYAPGSAYGGRLRKAASRGDVDTMKDLVARGCDPRGKDGLGYSLLHAAAASGHVACVDAAYELLKSACAKDDSSKFDVDARDKYGWSACACAAANGHARVVDRLLQLGASWRAKSNHGRSPLHWAAAKGRLDVVSLLLKKAGPDALNLHDDAHMTPLHLAAQHGHTNLFLKLGGGGGGGGGQKKKITTPRRDDENNNNDGLGRR